MINTLEYMFGIKFGRKSKLEQKLLKLYNDTITNKIVWRQEILHDLENLYFWRDNTELYSYLNMTIHNIYGYTGRVVYMQVDNKTIDVLTYCYSMHLIESIVGYCRSKSYKEKMDELVNKLPV